MNGLLLRAMQEHMPLQMIYLSTNKVFTERTILVEEIHESYIKAYCLLRKQKRTFNIQNILSILPNNKPNQI